MAETNGNQSNNQGSTDQAKTFTQEELDAIVTDRLARQAKKYADYDDLKAKAAEYDKQQDAGKSELQKLQEANQQLTEKLAGMEKQEKISKVRSKVSTDTGVPADLLTGEDEETCKKQADGILKFAKAKTAPGVEGNKHESRSSGTKAGSGPSRDDYRELAGQIFGRKD